MCHPLTICHCAAVFAILLALFLQLALWEGREGGPRSGIGAGGAGSGVVGVGKDVWRYLQGQGEADPSLEEIRMASSKPFGNVVVTARRAAEAHHTIPPEYLSFALDTSSIVGGKFWDPAASGIEGGSGSKHTSVFDFSHPTLNGLMHLLSPAYLRIGGSEADKVFYDMGSDEETPRQPPAGYESVLTGRHWREAQAFIARHQLKLVLTVNTGPSSRDASGAWNSSNAKQLLKHAKQRQDKIHVVELGNELNLYFYIYGLHRTVPAKQYAKDLARLRALLSAEFSSETLLAPQSSMIWPVLGEPLKLGFGMQEQALEEARREGVTLDVLGWHYYPQQSRRGPVGSRYAKPGRLLDPYNLDEVGHWAAQQRKLRDKNFPTAQLWVAETGNAQYGGEPGVSDTYMSSLWWLDQLGLLGLHRHHIVVRQTLQGLDYGMLDAEMKPLPDFWASALWKQVMLPLVHTVDVEGGLPSASLKRPSNDKVGKVRVYWHTSVAACGEGSSETHGTETMRCKDGEQERTESILIINLAHDHIATVHLPQIQFRQAELFAFSAGETKDSQESVPVLGKHAFVNGHLLRAEQHMRQDTGIEKRRFEGVLDDFGHSPVVTVQPLTSLFVRVI